MGAVLQTRTRNPRLFCTTALAEDLPICLWAEDKLLPILVTPPHVDQEQPVHPTVMETRSVVASQVSPQTLIPSPDVKLNALSILIVEWDFSADPADVSRSQTPANQTPVVQGQDVQSITQVMLSANARLVSSQNLTQLLAAALSASETQTASADLFAKIKDA